MTKPPQATSGRPGGLAPSLSPPRELANALAEKRAERERRVKDRRRRRMRQQRVWRLLLVAVPFLVGFAWHLRPVGVVVDGHRTWAWPRTSVAGAVAKAGAEVAYGDLVDVRGQRLAAGFGYPPTPTSGGRPISYRAPARLHRRISLERGADRRERTREQATLLPAPGGEDEWADGWKPAYLASSAAVAGIARTELGAISGLPAVVEQALAFPIAAAGAGESRVPKRLALTFDDGPNGDTTREILSILEASGAKGTFFLLADCVGRQKGLVAQEVAEGHEVGNHSWGHPQMNRMSVGAAMENIARAEATISAAAGRRCRWFRPPYGATTAGLRKAILEAGYNIALWSVDTEDWQMPGADTIYRRIMDGARPGAIILVHDGGDRYQTVAACRRAVPELVRQGYELVTLSELEMSLPGGDSGMVLLTNEGTWRAHLPGEPVHVFVHGRELSALAPMLAMGGHILLPAPAVLDALGANWEWDPEAQTVTVASLRGRFRLRVDSRRVSWDDRELRLEVPPLLYHDVPLVPAQVLARTAGASFRTSFEPITLEFSFADPVFSSRPSP